MKANQSIHCPYCHRYTALSIASGQDYDGQSRGSSITNTDSGKWWIGICNNCDNAVLVNQVFNSKNSDWDTVKISPEPLPKPISDRIPVFIKNDFLEANKCFGIGAFRATAVLCRRILQVICLEKGSKSDNLYKQIDELLVMGIITKDVTEWAHSVRWVGNNAAHPSLKNEATVEIEDARDILELVEIMIHILYVAGTIAKEKKEKFHTIK